MPRRFSALLALLLGGCALAEPPELDVEAQWSDAMRRLGMFAFYPATENVQVGDVFLLVPPPSGSVAWWGRKLDAVVPGSRPDHDGARFSLVRIATLSPDPRAPSSAAAQARLSLREHLAAQQAERLHVQPLPTPPKPDEGVAQADVNRQPPQLRPAIPAARGRPPQVGHADQEDIAPRLQRSAIPALRVARVSEAQLNASGVFGNVGAVLGLTSGRQTALTISLSNVQELQLDGWRATALYEANAQRMFSEQLAPEDLLFWLQVLRHGRIRTHSLVENACRGDEDKLRDQGVQVALVTRVVYAGAIDYGFSRSAQTALQAAADLAAVMSGPLTPQIPRTKAPAAPPPADGAPPPPPTPPVEPGARAQQELAARARGLPSLVHPSDPRAGAQLSLGVSSFGSLSLRETFNRPIAVGAGSRFVIPFHQALAGAEGQREARFRAAAAECERLERSAAGQHPGRQMLWTAMGGSGQAPAHTDAAQQGTPSGVAAPSRATQRGRL